MLPNLHTPEPRYDYEGQGCAAWLVLIMVFAAALLLWFIARSSSDFFHPRINTMSQNQPTAHLPGARPPSPMRVLRALWTRLISIDGPHFEHDILIGEVARETAAVTACAEESTQIEAHEQTLASRIHGYLTDPVTPGVIDSRESRTLARNLLRLKQTTHQHVEHLRALL